MTVSTATISIDRTPKKGVVGIRPVENAVKPKNISSVIQRKSFCQTLIAASAFTVASSPRGEWSMGTSE